MYSIDDLVFKLRYSTEGNEAVYENRYYRAVVNTSTLDIDISTKFGVGLELMPLQVEWEYYDGDHTKVSRGLYVSAQPQVFDTDKFLHLTQLRDLSQSTEISYLSAKNLEQALRNIVEIVNVTNGEKGEK